jgi:hypothetical protein
MSPEELKIQKLKIRLAIVYGTIIALLLAKIAFIK